MLRERVLPYVSELCAFFLPVCECIEIAGSLRRERPECHDADVVLQPIRDKDLFGGDLQTFSALHQRIGVALESGIIAEDPARKCDGKRYKRFCIPNLDYIGFEMWIAEVSNWGAIMAIRTGNPEFTKALVTARIYGGLLPNHLVQMDGFLWEYPSVAAAKAARDRGTPGDGVRLDCSTEEAFFAHLGFPAPLPRQRDQNGVALVKSYLAGL